MASLGISCSEGGAASISWCHPSSHSAIVRKAVSVVTVQLNLAVLLSSDLPMTLM